MTGVDGKELKGSGSMRPVLCKEGDWSLDVFGDVDVGPVRQRTGIPIYV